MKECEIFEEGSRKRKICEGTANLPIAKINAYRKSWGLDNIIDPPDIERISNVIHNGKSKVPLRTIQKNNPPRKAAGCSSCGKRRQKEVKKAENFTLGPVKLVGEGPGTVLVGIFKEKGVPTCDACTITANRMNELGVEGCRKEINSIIDEILPRAMEWIKQEYPWSNTLFPKTKNVTTRILIRRYVNKAIRQAEKNELAKPKKDTLSPFIPMDNPEFISSSQLQEDVKKLLPLIPHDITAVAGVARSGLSVAAMISMYTHLPLITIRHSTGDIEHAGNGWRLGGSQHIKPDMDRVLIVDDTVMTGTSLKQIKRIVEKEIRNYVTCAVYVNPKAQTKPDIYLKELNWPHLLEWNIFNSILSPNLALDFDGILCHNCSPVDDDDGDRYSNFIQNAKPLYLPRKSTIPLIITARIEKYREPTLEWLNKYGIKVDKLIMHPAKTLKEREKDDICMFKARHFKEWAQETNPKPPPLAFVESEDWQAQKIAKLSGHMVICPTTAKVY